MIRTLWRPWPQRLDPTEFPEDEFLVSCMQCGYELRALTASRCPECGEPFDRGHLLVLQYLKQRRPRSERLHHAGRFVCRAGFFAQGLGAIAWFGIVFVVLGGWLENGNPSLVWLVVPLLASAAGLWALGVVAVAVATFVVWFTLPKGHFVKARKVRERFLHNRRDRNARA